MAGLSLPVSPDPACSKRFLLNLAGVRPAPTDADDDTAELMGPTLTDADDDGAAIMGRSLTSTSASGCSTGGRGRTSTNLSASSTGGPTLTDADDDGAAILGRSLTSTSASGCSTGGRGRTSTSLSESSTGGDLSSRTPSPPLQLRRRRNLLAINLDLVKREAAWDPTLSSQEEVVRLNKEYDIMDILGQGSTSVVRRARRRCDGLDVSLKVVRTADPELLDVARRELGLLMTLDHPHIIKGYDIISTNTNIVLVLEMFDGSALMDAVRRAPQRRFGEETARHLFKALISAVAHLHDRGIVHRDVKADNVIVSNDLNDLRLIDFNTAQRVEEGGALTMTGTRDWAAPEVLCGDSPGFPHDVWGTGLCLYYMLTGHLPKQAHRCRNLEEYAAGLVKGIAQALGGEKLQSVTESCKEALQSCLEEDPDIRSTAEGVLMAAWCV